MNEAKLIDTIATTLSSIKIGKHRAFVQVITNNIPVWTAVKATPTVALYIESSQYDNKKGYATIDSEVVVYIYNRHRTNTISSKDILSDLIGAVRSAIGCLRDPNILSIGVTSSQRDGGTIHPYTMAELVIKVSYLEENKICSDGSAC